MKISDIEILIQEGEGTTLEYKERLSDSFTREMVAFANTAGGRILIGVRDDGTVDGLLFVERNTRVAYRIEKLQRENISEYPMKAVREAITNAVMHRDWFFEGANIFVEMYPDPLEVISPGGLPRGLTEAELGRRSVRRNALMADLLQRIGFIEGAGTGISRMQQHVRLHGSPEPQFRFDRFFTSIFKTLPFVAQEEAPQASPKYPPSTPQVPPKSLRS